MTEISADILLARGTDHVETSVGDQTMMMSIAQGKYYALEATAQRIWELLEQPRSLDDLVSLLRAEYDVPAEQCASDVTHFVADLLANGLLVESKDGASA